jgi:hypothetical protein
MNLSLGPDASGESFYNAASALHSLATAAPTLSKKDFLAGLDQSADMVAQGIDELGMDFNPKAGQAEEIANDVLAGIDALSTKVGAATASVRKSAATVEALEGLSNLAAGAGGVLYRM